MEKVNKIRILKSFNNDIKETFQAHIERLTEAGINISNIVFYGSFVRELLTNTKSNVIDVAVLNELTENNLSYPYRLNKIKFNNIEQLLKSIELTIDCLAYYNGSIYYFPEAMIDNTQNILCINNKQSIIEKPFDLLLRVFKYFSLNYTMDFRQINRIVDNIYEFPKYSDSDLYILSGNTVFNKGFIPKTEFKKKKLDDFDDKVIEGIKEIINILDLKNYKNLSHFYIYGSYMRSLFTDSHNKDIDVYCSDPRYVKVLKKRISFLKTKYSMKIDLSTHPCLIQNDKFLFWNHTVEAVYYSYTENLIYFNVESFEDLSVLQLGLIPDSYNNPYSMMFRMLKYSSKGYKIDFNDVKQLIFLYRNKKSRFKYFINRIKKRKIFDIQLVR